MNQKNIKILTYCFILISLFITLFANASPCEKQLKTLKHTPSNNISPKDTLKSLRIRKTNEEKTLEKQGLPKIYTAGVDKANEIIQVKRKLEKINVDPYTTHIPYFASQINDHIKEIRNGIQKETDKRELLVTLKEFEKEAQDRTKHKKVTYHWWLIFNLRLATLATNLSKNEGLDFDFPSLLHYEREKVQEERDLDLDESKDPEHKRIKMSVAKNIIIVRAMNAIRTHESMTLFLEKSRNAGLKDEMAENIDTVMKKFPKEMMFPVTGELGIMAFNKTAGTGSHLINLSGDYRIADNTKFPPLKFFAHDIAHAKSISIESISLKKKIQNLSNNNRQKLEVAYFIIAHEYPRSGFFTKKDNKTEEEYKKSLKLEILDIDDADIEIILIDENLIHILGGDNSIENMKAFFKEAVDIFFENIIHIQVKERKIPH